MHAPSGNSDHLAAARAHAYFRDRPAPVRRERAACIDSEWLSNCIIGAN
jgi:hypothetical protein